MTLTLPGFCSFQSYLDLPSWNRMEYHFISVIFFTFKNILKHNDPLGLIFSVKISSLFVLHSGSLTSIYFLRLHFYFKNCIFYYTRDFTISWFCSLKNVAEGTYMCQNSENFKCVYFILCNLYFSKVGFISWKLSTYLHFHC